MFVLNYGVAIVAHTKYPSGLNCRSPSFDVQDKVSNTKSFKVKVITISYTMESRISLHAYHASPVRHRFVALHKCIPVSGEKYLPRCFASYPTKNVGV